jgi:hypothetical protein
MQVTRGREVCKKKKQRKPPGATCLGKFQKEFTRKKTKGNIILKDPFSL